ncbi:ATP-binding protein [Actinomycetospora sp.]|jgi:signal transduction histidine kinase|uniref:ATP-binding protein n=1 Tax=Actinomycetospora sp. TaxID=1872135 RepID=UPI002F4073C1
MDRVLDYLPHGDLISDEQWGRRHRFLLWVLASLCPALAIFGFAVGNGPALTIGVALIPVVTALGGWLTRHHRTAGSLFVTAGLSASSAGLVILSGGYIEAHFAFFVIIGFLALYQNWVPFVFDIAFTTLSHGLGSLLVPTLMFNHHMGQMDPWLWSVIHGIAVLLACVGVSIFCRITEDEQRMRAALAGDLANAEIKQQEFTSELLLNLARRNQSMFHRQLDIINDLEERERDPDALAELFRLDHLATRVRRNAESLLVLSGEQPARVWSAPVPLRDVVRAGIAETEDLERVAFTVDERPRVIGAAVADLTHMIAELTENAVRFSPPTTTVNIQSRVYHPAPGAHLVIIEDIGVGMPSEDLGAAIRLLAGPQEVDVSTSRRLGFHVVSRLASRHGIEVTLTPTPGCGLTAVIVIPAALFADPAEPVAAPATAPTRAHHADSPASDGIDRPAAVGHASDGRHSWPGRSPADVVRGPETGAEEPVVVGHVLPESPPGTDTLPGGLAAPDPTPVRPGAHTTPPRSTGLIHPTVVPPPAEGVPSAMPSRPAGPRAGVAAPAPRTPHESEQPVLKRRVPQTHLAPELIRPRPDPAADAHAGPGNGNGHLPGGRDGGGNGDHTRAGNGHPGDDHAGPGPSGALSALSQYQASRRAARDALSEDPAQGADLSAARGAGSTDSHDGGRS